MDNNEREQEYGKRKAPSLIISVAVAVIIVIAFFIGIGIYIGYKNTSEAYAPPEIAIDIDTMRSSLEDIASLATEEYNFTNVATFSEEKVKVLFVSIPFTGKNCLMTYSGVVKAGIKDCTGISVDVQDLKKQIIITCPNVELFDDPVIDPNSIEIYDYSKSILTPITIEDFAEFEKTEQDAARQQALDSGLLEKAEKSAHDLIYSQANAIIQGSKYNDYYVYVEFE